MAFIPLVVVTAAAEYFDTSMAEDVADYMEEELDKVYEAVLSTEVMEEVLAHMKMGLTYQISPVTLNMSTVLHSQTIQEKLFQKTLYAPSSWKIKLTDHQFR